MNKTPAMSKLLNLYRLILNYENILCKQWHLLFLALIHYFSRIKYGFLVDGFFSFYKWFVFVFCWGFICPLPIATDIFVYKATPISLTCLTIAQSKVYIYTVCMSLFECFSSINRMHTVPWPSQSMKLN